MVGTEDGGLAHVFLIANSATATLANNNAVSVSAQTNYPFEQTITYTISASAPFPFYVRIPTWALPNSTITAPGSTAAKPISPNSQGLQKVQIPAGSKSSFTVTLSAAPRIVQLANNTVGIYYGALLYSLAIDYNSTFHAPISFTSQQPLPGTTIDAHTHDYYYTPTSPWNIAVDPSQIKVVRQNNTTPGAALKSPIWDLGAPPVELRVAAVQIDWPIVDDLPADPPSDPTATGKPFSARFVPYGSAKLHMAHLPVVTLPKMEL